MVDEFVNEGIPEQEPVYGDEVADIQRAAELSIKEQAERTQGPARPVVIREPDYGRIQPLPDVQGKGKEKINAGTQDEGQAGPNIGEQDEESQPQSIHAVHAGPNLEHMDFEEKLKLPTKDQLILKELASSVGTMSSLQNLDKELSLTNQFLMEKSHDDEPDKSNTKAEVQSMVMVPIHHHLFSSSNDHSGYRSHNVTTCLHNSLSTTTNINNNYHNNHNNNSTNSSTITKHHRSDPCPPHRRTRTTYGGPITRQFSPGGKVGQTWNTAIQLGEAQYSPQARKKRRKRRDTPRSPPRSPPSQPPPPAGASVAPGAQELSPLDDLMHDDSAPDEQVHVSDDQYSRNDHTPAAADSRKDWWKPLPKEERPATPEPAWTILSSHKDMTTFLNSYCQRMNKTMLTQADFEGQAYEVVKAFYPDANPEGDQVRINVNRPLPIGGPPGHVTIQTNVFFNKDLEYLQYGSKGSCPALSISKMKAASYPDFGLELLVPEQMWINDVCTYNISVKYGISHWWFTRQKFYIDRHESPSRRKEIAEKDFKNLYPSDFEDLNLLLLQGHLDHLFGLDKQMLSTAIKLWTRWDATRYEFKHDYTIIESPRAVIFPVNNNEQKIMRFNKIYKFSDGTLTPILETLDYRVKEFKIKRLNLGMNMRFWTEKDVTRSKEFITTMEGRLKTRRIYQNLECFVGGRVRDIDYRLLQRTE
ncbi:hypothetical protein Tco_1040432 [Tanacetum coccineum]